MKKVIVVEDNKDNLELITLILQRSGYEVAVAMTGEDGVVLALQESPLFIVMDIDLPGIDGFEATRRIRQSGINGEVPIIAITSHAMRGDRMKVLESGCTAYFEKPINPLTIMNEIHALIGDRRHENPDC